ncbi:unnamed protein product [Rotaria socialis]|uniref:Cystinosin homolog n=2 Tax=Rotaria socialis TaxID=392032 RepID=A0A817U7Q1_9BILA|nr:unnamed protein product [Rotaria socialis]CAF3324910.1 unnamed protein product [Rotaria socialis]CAF3327819.1 unnamed protein product [Rotaria socialis]CAF3656441.1 unnamed protein product [Rotaria socialis]CAF3665283.1 unnamed protein product [Rotaria socialis]
MNSRYLFIVYALFLFINVTTQYDSVISFKPSSLSIAVGENKSVNIRLLKTDVTFPISVEFLYDGKTNNTQCYIESVPNVTFVNHSTADLSQVFYVYGRRQGHLVITARSSEVNISSVADFLLIDIARSNILNIFIQIVGWIYFAAWSISFYPQIILNFQRRSVTGLNFDFLALNILGHSCYSVFNVVLYTSSKVQQEYYVNHPHGVLPVLLNDVIFSCHAVFACIVTVIQCLLYERGSQRVSHTARVLGGIGLVFLFISSIVSATHHLSTLSLLYFFSYVKLAITIIKYCPQAWMNYKRKSTDGWSIGNILLDFTGGALSLVQMFLLSTNYNDWSSIFGSPTKLGLGLFSILFDLVFIIQHYILYRTRDHDGKQINITNDDFNENAPILPRKV